MAKSLEAQLEENDRSSVKNMPRKRPRDFSQAAKLVIDVAAGQVEDREQMLEKDHVGPSSFGRH
jgi:hypothetical protein